MKIRPISNRVVVKRDERDDKTPGGIIIPDNAKEPLTRGTVISVGPGKRSDSGAIQEPMVRTGDHVLFGKYSGSEVRFDAEDLVIMTEDDIYGIIEE